MKNRKKLLIIAGPTATGKTSLAVKLAQKFKGELVSADSRQVYKFMDIGTGKDVYKAKFEKKNTKLKLKIEKEANSKINLGIYQIGKIRLWGLDLIAPDEEFSVAHWLVCVQNIIQDIWQRQKLPIVVGGTGFWLKALINGIASMGIPPDWKLREKLSSWPLAELSDCLKKIDKKRWQRMNQSDKKNPRRLIRAIEIAKAKIKNSLKINPLEVDSLLIIGLKADNKFLYQRIDERVEKRIKQGVEKEVKSLIKKGYGWDLESMKASGYKEWRFYFSGQAGLEEVIKRWQFNEHSYARRQMTLFKKIPSKGWSSSGRKKIHWFDIEKKEWQKKVAKLVASWYD